MTVKIQVVDEFNQWQELLNLLFSAFEFQHSRIDPPSSLLLLNVNSIIEKASAEQLMVALKDGELVGCVFVRNQGDLLYVGKLAVAKHLQGCGIARQLMQEVESYAKGESKEVLELQVRIELVENIAAFSALGFVESGRTAHRGYDRMTSVTMQKLL